MEQKSKVLSAAEAAEYGEFKRARREAEIAFTMKKLIPNASRRETDRPALKHTCELAVKYSASGVLVSPVNVSAAKKQLGKGGPNVCCLVGGTGESLTSIKKAETKRALRMGAKEIRLVLCYSQLAGGGYSYLKREIRRIRRTVRKGTLVVSLEDRSLGEEEIALGVRAAAAGKADAVCVRGESGLILHAVNEAAGRLGVEASGVQNAEQLRLVIKSGAARVTTECAEKIFDELYLALESSVPL